MTQPQEAKKAVGARERAASHTWGAWRVSGKWSFRNCTAGCGAGQKVKTQGGPLWNIGGAKMCVAKKR